MELIKIGVLGITSVILILVIKNHRPKQGFRYPLLLVPW